METSTHMKPWGQFEQFSFNEPCTVKIITVNPNEELSLQSHAHRDEEWKILQGSGSVVIGEETIEAKVGDEFKVMRGTKHRVAGGPSGILFLEVAFGDFDENDIVRFEDRYGRV